MSAELVQSGDESGFKVVGVTSSAYYWPYLHNPRRSFLLHGNMQSTRSENTYQVVNPGDVYLTDSFILVQYRS